MVQHPLQANPAVFGWGWGVPVADRGGQGEDLNCACLLHTDIAFRLGFFVIETQRGGKKKVSMTKSVLQQWLTSMEILSIVL